MRTLLTMLVFATAAAFASEITFDQANALASKDSASLDADQLLVLTRSQSRASDVVLAKCPKQVKPGDFASFTVVTELDGSGKIVRTWLQGSTPLAECFNKGMLGQTLFKPPHAPFYASNAMYWQQ